MSFINYVVRGYSRQNLRYKQIFQIASCQSALCQMDKAAHIRKRIHNKYIHANCHECQRTVNLTQVDFSEWKRIDVCLFDDVIWTFVFAQRQSNRIVNARQKFCLESKLTVLAVSKKYVANIKLLRRQLDLSMVIVCCVIFVTKSISGNTLKF